jgi:hypothetical protein
MINLKGTDFTEYDWTYFYQDTKENIHPNAPETRVNPMQINALVDANHARNQVT